MIHLNTLNVVEGDVKITFSEVEPEARKALAKQVLRLKKEGYAVMLEEGGETSMIEGYDATTNEWVLKTPRQEKGKTKRGRRKSATNTTVTSVAPTSGG